MELLNNLVFGFSAALSPINLWWAFFGCLVGTLVGVLPGLGALASIAMLLPLTYQLEPGAGIIMLAGLYYGAQYGGSTSSILLNLPGETSSAVTALEGHKMALAGRAGPALSVAAMSSFFAGCIATLLLGAFASVLANVAIEFGPAEYFALMVLGLIGAIILASGSILNAFAMIVLGLLLGTVGTDINSGVSRFSFGYAPLAEGISVVALSMGLFGIPEIIANLERGRGPIKVLAVGRLWPTRQDIRRILPATVRGTMLGSMLGLLPGGGPTLAAFGAYTIEKKTSRHRDEFGSGAIEGVAAPEAANNAAAQMAFVPTLALGVPGSAVMALIVSALVIHNIQPGPMVMTREPTLFWGLIASMWIGNAFLLILNLPLVGMWASIMRIPYRYLYPSIIVFSCIGAFSVVNSSFDILQLGIFGLIGFVFFLLGCEPAPLLLGFVLGPLIEEKFRRALLISGGDFTIFVSSWISISLLLAAAVLLVVFVAPAMRAKREEIFEE